MSIVIVLKEIFYIVFLYINNWRDFRIIPICEAFPHRRVSLQVFQFIIIDKPHVPILQSLSQCKRHLGFCKDDLCFSLDFIGFHLLLLSYGHGTSFLGFGLSNVFVRISSLDLQTCTNILTEVNICDVNREYLESCTLVKSLIHDKFGYIVRILHHFFMSVSRSNTRDNTFSHTGKYSFLSSTTNKFVDV